MSHYVHQQVPNNILDLLATKKNKIAVYSGAKSEDVLTKNKSIPKKSA